MSDNEILRVQLVPPPAEPLGWRGWLSLAASVAGWWWLIHAPRRPRP